MSTRLLFFFLLLSLSTFSQDLFQDISFSKALQQARSDRKLIFLQFESASCLPCNETADKALSDPNLIQRLHESFICLKITKQHDDKMEFNIAPAPLHTYARLLYKQGQKEKAIELETQAVELMKQRKLSADSYEKALENMKQNLL